MTRVVCVTGTSKTPTRGHEDALRRLLTGADVVHHGLCVGADALAHKIAVELGVPIIGHPGVDRDGRAKRRAELPSDEFASLRDERWFLDRNVDMVVASSEVVALVERATYYRSGEWFTINAARYARVPTTLVLPDGKEIPA